MLYLLLAVTSANVGLSAWSHKRLREAIRSTREDLTALITGRVREVGPIEAQSQALKAQAVERATARRARPSPITY